MRRLFTLVVMLCALRSYAQMSIAVNFDDTSYVPLVSIDTVNYNGRQWQVGSPHKILFTSAFSAPHAIVTDSAMPYTADTSAFIIKVPSHTMPPSDMPYLWSLYFEYMLDIDTGAMAKVELSCNGGNTWHDMTRETGSGFYFQNSMSSSWGLDLDTNVVNGLKVMSIMFPGGHDSLVSDTSMFRFTFAARNNVSGREGWILDNIQIHYYAEAAVNGLINDNILTIYPNPAGELINVQSNKTLVDIKIFDVAGREVLQEKHWGCKEAQVNISALRPGMYTIIINGIAKRQFIKD